MYICIYIELSGTGTHNLVLTMHTLSNELSGQTMRHAKC